MIEFTKTHENIYLVIGYDAFTGDDEVFFGWLVKHTEDNDSHWWFSPVNEIRHLCCKHMKMIFEKLSELNTTD